MAFYTHFLGLTALALLAAGATSVTDIVAVAVPAPQPPFAKPMDASLVSMSLEFQFWPIYAGNATGQPNHYVNQLLANLAERTGKTPAIRVGGTSENTAYVETSLQLWNASQLSEVFGPFLERANTSIGRDWYVIAGNLRAGTEFTFGLNLYDNDQVRRQAQMIAEAFQDARSNLTKDVELKFIQVGNEPNLYFLDAATYVSHWKPLAETVLQEIKMGGDDNPTFWVGSEVVSSSLPLPFELTGTLEAGILQPSDIDAATNVFDEHLYSGSPGFGVPGDPPPGTLMNKASIRGNLSSLYNGMLNTQSYDKTYYLGETNTYSGGGIYGLSNTGESAIWAVDYMLKLASMGVHRAYLHSTPNRMFSVFQPGWGFTNGTGISRPHIMPMYNGLLVVNEMVGKTRNAKIAEIETGNAALASYGVWESGKLLKIALINSNFFDQNATVRSALDVMFSGGYTGGCASVKRLSIPYTTATEGIAWAGQSFETDSGVPSGDVIQVAQNGTSIVVAASEVVVLEMTDQC